MDGRAKTKEEKMNWLEKQLKTMSSTSHFIPLEELSRNLTNCLRSMDHYFYKEKEIKSRNGGGKIHLSLINHNNMINYNNFMEINLHSKEYSIKSVIPTKVLKNIHDVMKEKGYNKHEKSM